MFERISPEEAGISSDTVRKFTEYVEKRGGILHGVLMMRNGKIFSEQYWAPFHRDFCHRMYSQTKSYTAIAIGLLEQEGKLSLDDRLIDHFPDKIDGDLIPEMRELTIREMLTMTTLSTDMHVAWWFTSGDPDRTHLYINRKKPSRASGTLWEYDSAGSQVMASLVDRLAGMPLLAYLKSRLFDKMGTFGTAEMLRTANGDSWGDSALVCTMRDMASVGQLLINGGSWNGEQLLNEKFVREATSKRVDNRKNWFQCSFTHGYGYQIWRTEQNGFAFVGMGDELTVCLPDRNLVLVTTGDHQGTDNRYRDMMLNAFFDMIVDEMKDEPLPANPAAEERLATLNAGLKLRAEQGLPDSPFRTELDGKVFACAENPMGITKVSFHFAEDGKTGEFRYTNAQGDKVLPFGVNHNVFGKFPQLGYSNDFGGLRTDDGFMYNDAVSFAWLDEKKFIILTQVIDRYFGLMSAVFAFRDGNVAALFQKVGEDFFDEYQGELYGKEVK